MMQSSVSLGWRWWSILFVLFGMKMSPAFTSFSILPCSGTIFEKNSVSFVSSSINDSFAATMAFLRFLDPSRLSSEPSVAELYSIVI